MDENLIFSTKYEELDKLLKDHQNVAFDLDETLIGDNLYKRLFHMYIIRNATKKHFCIITFRDETYARYIADDMKNENCSHLLKYFDEIIHCPYTYIEQQTMTDQKPIERWKGSECRKRGYTILLDDNIRKVIRGAIRYDIVLVNSKTVKRVI